MATDPRITLEFYGMCCAAPDGEEDAGDQKVFRSLDVVLPHVGGHMRHHARLIIPTEWVVFEDHGDAADDCIAGPRGDTFYVWRLDDRELTVTAGTGAKGRYRNGKLGKVKRPTKDQEEDIRWLPSLKELTGLPFDETNRHVRSGIVNSVVHVTGGGLLQTGLGPLMSIVKFQERGKPDPKDEHVIAERIIYDIATDELPVIKLGDATIQLALPDPRPPVLAITVSHLPTYQHDIDPEEELPHFRQFYNLLRSGAATQEPVPIYVDRVPKPMIEFSFLLKPFFSDLLDLIHLLTAYRGGRPVQCGSART